MNSQNYIEIINEVSEKVRTEFSSMTAEQLNWKPNPKKWSIAQCIQHIIITNSTYYPALESIGSGDYKLDFWAKFSPFSNFFGNYMVKTQGPERYKSYTTSPIFTPTSSSLPADIVQQFVNMNVKTISFFQRVLESDHEETVIHSPALYFITYRVHHVIALVARHEQRHFLQMMDVKALLPES